MLRLVKTYDDSDRITLLVEGRIVAEWLDFLEQECQRHLDAGRRLTLDLSQVAYAGPGGVELLRRLTRQGTELAGARPLLRDMLSRRP